MILSKVSWLIPTCSRFTVIVMSFFQEFGTSKLSASFRPILYVLNNEVLYPHSRFRRLVGLIFYTLGYSHFRLIRFWHGPLISKTVHILSSRRSDFIWTRISRFDACSSMCVPWVGTVLLSLGFSPRRVFLLSSTPFWCYTDAGFAISRVSTALFLLGPSLAFLALWAWFCYMRYLLKPSKLTNLIVTILDALLIYMPTFFLSISIQPSEPRNL
ncbi:hypothetical protein BDN72DRAFT_474841 [Pluteus cervinus]|uniref:Uncharacterized protein n=1 Tax=Pluteus cervinus TaxID=181527 RepID=A0ACD3B037_9AGAR|nr:hypothetical protein BDN72DRAFT_474841 [Pluteus cervinus]